MGTTNGLLLASIALLLAAQAVVVLGGWVLMKAWKAERLMGQAKALMGEAEHASRESIRTHSESASIRRRLAGDEAARARARLN